MKAEELIKRLETEYKGQEIACILWTRGDVASIDDTLSDDQCDDILNRIDNNKDCTLGITWDTLENEVVNYQLNKR